MLEIQDVHKSYGGRQVLAPVSLCLEAGEGLGVVGPNGSGKSTLLRLIAQVERPDGGRVLFQGRDVLGDRRFLRRQLGYVPQSDQLSPELTVGQQLKLWQAACDLPGPLPGEVSGLMGLEPMLRTPISRLSGGMRQRVSIAMALLQQPEILVMDEATVGLDRHYGQALLAWLEEFVRRGGSLIWCTHRPGELRQLCGRCLRLEEGQARWGGPEREDMEKDTEKSDDEEME